MWRGFLYVRVRSDAAAAGAGFCCRRETTASETSREQSRRGTSKNFDARARGRIFRSAQAKRHRHQQYDPYAGLELRRQPRHRRSDVRQRRADRTRDSRLGKEISQGRSVAEIAVLAAAPLHEGAHVHGAHPRKVRRQLALQRLRDVAAGKTIEEDSGPRTSGAAAFADAGSDRRALVSIDLRSCEGLFRWFAGTRSEFRGRRRGRCAFRRLGRFACSRPGRRRIRSRGTPGYSRS